VISEPDDVVRRATRALTSGLFGVALVTGLSLRVSQLRPDGLTSYEVYNAIFSAHGAALFALLPAVVSRFSLQRAGTPSALNWLALLAVGLIVPGTILAGLLDWPTDAAFPQPIFVAPLLLVAIIVAIQALVGVRASRWSAGSLALAGAGLLLVPAVVGSLASVLPQALALAGLALLVDDPTRRGTFGADQLLVAVLLLAAVLNALSGAWSILAGTASLVASGWLSIRVARLALRGSDSLPFAGYSVLCAAMFFEGVVATQLLALLSAQEHMGGTTFVTGAFHFKVCTVVLAALALDGRPAVVATRPARTFWWLESTLVALGTQVFCGGLLLLGARGQPSRYFKYLPEFQELHVAVTAASISLALGLALAFVRRSRDARVRARAALP